MSSTNKTTNYELSQFIGTDKPAWLADYNTDMGKIDAQMKLNADGITSASGTATSATTAIGTLANLTTTAKTDLVSAINEVDSNADTAQGTANTASNTANIASGKVTALTNKFSLTASDYTNSDITVTNGTLANDSHIYIATNSDGSLFKVYGRCTVTLTGTNLSTIKLTLGNTGIPADSSYQIICAGFAFQSSNIPLGIAPITLTIRNNAIDIEFIGRSNGEAQIAQIEPSLYFNSNFGDLPTPD